MALLAPLDPTGEQSNNGTVPVEEIRRLRE
jgi:hypothetical protein